MQIIVNSRVAVLKEGSSFDFIAENRLFSGSDSYTLTITFPLKDCPQNIEIFGHIHRSEIVPEDITFDCEIRDKEFSRFGTLAITEISDIEMKAQFLEGRSEQNFAKDFDETYINDLSIQIRNGSPTSMLPAIAWNSVYDAVALPWVSADSGISHNFADYDESSGSFKWSADTRDLTFLPYLLPLTKRICDALGYSYDLSQWQNHPWLAKILVCNVLPGSWDLESYARALPHWTVAEYFEKLELFLCGEFTIDHREKSISFQFSISALEDIPPICLESVVDEHTMTVKSDGADCDYMEAKSFAYKDDGHQLSNYYSCPWFLRSLQQSQVESCQSLTSLIGSHQDYLSTGLVDWAPGTNSYKDPELEKIFYVENKGLYFVLRHIDRFPSEIEGKPRDLYALQPLNEFGPSGDAQDSDDCTDIEFVPACVDNSDKEHGFCLFVNFGSYSEDDDSDDSEYRKSTLQRTLESGPKSDAPEYFSVINVAYYNGYDSESKLPPQPRVSNLIIDLSSVQTWQFLDFSFSLNDAANGIRQPYFRIDRTRKVTFKFLADDIPNPRALFYIHGRRYICEKITATFTEDGMSQLLKGEFWPLLDD